MTNKNNNWKQEAIKLAKEGLSWRKIAKQLDIPRSTVSDFLRSNIKSSVNPKILIIDVETAPLLGAVWSLWNNNVALNQLERDWYIISWAAKWLDEDEIFYQDKRDTWDNEDDSELLQGIWELLDEADIVIGQNLDHFDIRKLNARFIINGMKPPSSYKTIDTVKIAKKHFGFTSNKLEYMTEKLCKRYKKQKHDRFPGFELWSQCLKGNMSAWNCMETYNIYDILSLEELYHLLKPWYKSHPNLNVYRNGTSMLCICGNDNFDHNGYVYTNVSKFDRFQCSKCGYEMRGSVNLVPKNVRKELLRNVK